jgi:hypothetical protein
MFANAFKKHKYEGKYFIVYCTKSSIFHFVVEEKRLSMKFISRLLML